MDTTFLKRRKEERIKCALRKYEPMGKTLTGKTRWLLLAEHLSRLFFSFSDFLCFLLC